MYASPHMDPDKNRVSLQNKVQFDIRFYFCRCGCENMHTMKKSMFEIVHDDSLDIDCVIKVEDEATKNHCETDQPILTNFIPGNKEDKMCPVRSFRMYLSHLNPENEYLWQTPNHHPKDPLSPVWYTIGHIGKNTLGSFMTNLESK